jgi:AraC-like DNA-binding protein
VTIIFEERPSDSPYLASVTRGRTIAPGAPTRPAEVSWHMVLLQHQSQTRMLLVGPWSQSGTVTYPAGGELLWIKFSLGTFMPHLPTRSFVDSETPLPGTAGPRFWLHSDTWQYPDFENVETFAEQLAREGALARDPLVDAALQGHRPDAAPRTVRHRFAQSTGLSQNHIEQFWRAQRAVSLLQQGHSIADTVFEAGYYDQPHLTRAVKRFIGRTPGEIVAGLDGGRQTADRGRQTADRGRQMADGH